MKVFEKITHQDGATSSREFNIEMEKGKSAVCWTLCPTDGEPLSVRIIKSGWFDHGQSMYHVLSEWGAYEETSYSHLTQDQLLEIYPEFREILNHHYQDVVVESQELQSTPNDGELGKIVRKKSISK